MPDSCLSLYILGRFQLQKVWLFPRNKLRTNLWFCASKIFIGTRCLMATSEYSNGQSGKGVDWTRTVILGKAGTFGIAVTYFCSSGCLNMGSLWSELCFLFDSQMCFPFQSNERGWYMSAGERRLGLWVAVKCHLTVPNKKSRAGLATETGISLSPGIIDMTPVLSQI